MAGFKEDLEKMLVETEGWLAAVEITARTIGLHMSMHDLSLQIMIMLGRLKVAGIATEAATYNMPLDFSNLVLLFTDLQEGVRQVTKLQSLRMFGLQ